MFRIEVQLGHGCAFVRRRHGGWRRIVLFDGWCAVLASATVQPPAVADLAAQHAPAAVAWAPLLPRPGPAILRT